MKSVRSLFLVIACVALVSLTACAAKGLRNQTRVGALTVGEAVKGLDSAEVTLAHAGIAEYTAELQSKVNNGIRTVAIAARAYERAVKGWDGQGSVPQQIATARAGVLKALDDLTAILPAASRVRTGLDAAIQALRVAVSSASVADAHPSVPVSRSQLPAGLMSIIALANVIGSLLTSGRSSIEKIKAALKKEGATDAELDALDRDLTEIIDRRSAPPSA